MFTAVLSHLSRAFYGGILAWIQRICYILVGQNVSTVEYREKKYINAYGKTIVKMDGRIIKKP
jgi:hypothetical protein